MRADHRLALLAGILSILFLATMPMAASASSHAQDVPPRPLDAVAGQTLYAQNCAPCHGQTGGGDGSSAAGLGASPTAFADYAAIADLSLTGFFTVTKTGRMDRLMPPWSSRLTDDQIWDTVAYAWTLHTSATAVVMGQAVYETNCATCHGPDGTGKPPMLDFSDFATTSGVAQSAWVQVVASGRGEMPAFGDKLSTAEQRSALEYVRSLSFGKMFREPLQPGPGVVTGAVTNGTTGQPVPDLSVQLGIFDSTSVLEQRSATTDAAGVYRFEALPSDTTLTYITRAEYPAGSAYSSETASFAADQAALDLPITVYETTADGAGVRADRVHFIVEFEAGQAYIAELFVFSLDGKRSYIGDGASVLHFTLPIGAQGLEISDGELGGRYLPTQDGFVDTLPLPPGQGVRQTLFRYTLPVTGDTLDLVRTLPYPATNVNALISDVGEQVTSTQLANQGVRETQNGNYINLVGENLAANQVITLRISNLSGAGTAAATGSAPAPATTNRALTFILIGLAGLAVVALGAWPLLRRRTTAEQLPVLTDRERLIDALARLEITHDAGEITDAAYRDQRLRLKAQLLDLTHKVEK